MKHPHPAINRAEAKIAERAEKTGASLLVCDRCGHEMVVRNTQVQDDPCRNDVRLKCPTTDDPDALKEKYGITPDGCGWWTRHGIPIPRQEYDHEMERRDHPVVDAVNTAAPDSTVEERLAALGYIDQ